jgi:hypothetical protein
MSRSYQEDLNAAKAVRQGVEEQRPLIKGRKDHKARPYVMYYRWTEEAAAKFGTAPFSKRMRLWSKRGSYRTREEAEKAAADLMRKQPSFETQVRERP